VWLPQWSFDFWIMPYLAGRGVTSDQFREFMLGANALLRLETKGVTGEDKATFQTEALSMLTRALATWDVDAGAAMPRSPQLTQI
jgi:p-methyltransferase